MHTTVRNSFSNNFFAFFISPAFMINKCIFDDAHEADLVTIFFDEFRNVVGFHAALEYINTHFDHIRNQCSCVAVRMMNNIFYTMVFVITVNLFIRIQEVILKHGRTEECTVMAAPVIMMENHIRMKMITDTFCQFQFPFSQIFDHIMHFIFIIYVIIQSIYHFAEMMCLFKKTRSDEWSFEGFFSIYSIIHCFALIPCFLWKIKRRCFYIIFPVLNVFYYNFVWCMNRKSTWYIVRETVGNTPCIYNIQLTFLRCGTGKHKWMEKKFNSFVLVYITVRLSAWLHTFDHILFSC